jgi:hypothetical protein
VESGTSLVLEKDIEGRRKELAECNATMTPDVMQVAPTLCILRGTNDLIAKSLDDCLVSLPFLVVAATEHEPFLSK